MSIATALGKSQAAARQTVHRARERVRADRPRFAAPPDAKERLLGRFIGALETGDKDALLALFAEDARHRVAHALTAVVYPSASQTRRLRAEKSAENLASWDRGRGSCTGKSARTRPGRDESTTMRSAR